MKSPFTPIHGLVLAFFLIFLPSAVSAARFSTVVIDPGHGGKDKGAYWGGVRESHLNVKIAQRLEALLKKRGLKTAMTRRSDVFVSLERRAAIANRYRSSVFVSIHFNASTTTSIRGVETYYWGSTGKTIASAIQRRIAPRLNTRNRGVRRRGFTVLMKTRAPAVLVECGFISSRSERARCLTSSYQQTAAQAIYDGLMACR